MLHAKKGIIAGDNGGNSLKLFFCFSEKTWVKSFIYCHFRCILCLYL